MDEINTYEVVKKLIGSIEPIGETDVDKRRFENLKKMTQLIDALLTDVDNVIPYKRRAEFSMKQAGEFADKFFERIGIEN